MDPSTLLDGPSALIVGGGTLLATALRSGLADCRITLVKLGGLGRRGFDLARTRSELGLQIQEIRQDGLLRAVPHHSGDAEFDEATDALIGRRSVAALLEAHQAHRTRRLGESERAARTLAQAAELAPVFGLAGTLISLSQLSTGGVGQGAFAGSIAMAVTTTLYGLLVANLLLAPLSRMVERKALAEELERQEVTDWLAAQVEAACAQRPSRVAQREAAA